MNPQLLAKIHARRKNLGDEDLPVQKPKITQAKTQTGNKQNFSEARKLLQANLFKTNVTEPKQEQTKQQIKGNSQNMKKARQMLQGKLKFGGDESSSNTIGNLPPPPPSMGNVNLPFIGNLPPPPPPPPPSFTNLPPPPSLANLPPPPPPPKFNNLPPPPPPQKLNNPTIPTNLSPSNVPIYISPPHSSINKTSNNIPSNLPNLPPPPSFNNTNINNSSTNTYNNKNISNTSNTSSASNVSNRVSSKLAEDQFQRFQTQIKKESSVQKKKSIFTKQSFPRSSNMPINQYSKQNNNPNNFNLGYNKSNQKVTNNEGNKSDYKINELGYRNIENVNQIKNEKMRNEERTTIKNKQIENVNMNKNKNVNVNEVQQRTKNMSESVKRNKIFPKKQNSISADFFGKDVSGYLKKQFIKSNDILSYIGKKPTDTQNKVSFQFPSILKGTRGDKDTNIQPRQTLYVDTKNLNLVGSFMVNNLNCIRDHNQSRQNFVAKLKDYDIEKDLGKLNLKIIKQLVDTVPQFPYTQLNIVKISHNIRKCEALKKKKAMTQEFEECTRIKQLQSELQKLVYQYFKYPEDCTDDLQRIERILSKINEAQ